MAKCQHCGNGIEGNQIVYRDANKGRRAQSIRLCWRCVDRYDKTEAAKKVRNIFVLVVGAVILLGFAGYILMHR